MAKPWVKLYTEVNRDPKIITLTWAQRGIWTALLAVAGEIDERGEDGRETGALDSIEYTALRIRCDLAEFTDALKAFVARSWVQERDGVLYITHYQRRQEVPPSQTREAQRDRQRTHRQSQPCHTSVTTLSRDVTPSEADVDTESDTEADVDAEAPAQAPITRAIPETAAAAANSLGTLLESHGIRVASPVQVDIWRDLYQDAGPALFQKALREAVETAQGIPKPKYVRSIIDRCRKEGLAPGQWRDPPDRASPSRAAAPPHVDPPAFRNPLSGKVEQL